MNLTKLACLPLFLALPASAEPEANPQVMDYAGIESFFNASAAPSHNYYWTNLPGLRLCPGQTEPDEVIFGGPQALNPIEISGDHIKFPAKTAPAGEMLVWEEKGKRHELRQQGDRFVLKTEKDGKVCYAAAVTASKRWQREAGVKYQKSHMGVSSTLESLVRDPDAFGDSRDPDGSPAVEGEDSPLWRLGGQLYAGHRFHNEYPVFNGTFTKPYEGQEVGGEIRFDVRPKGISGLKGIDVIFNPSYTGSADDFISGRVDLAARLRYWLIEQFALSVGHSESWNVDSSINKSNVFGHDGAQNISATWVEALYDPFGLEFKHAKSGVMWFLRAYKVPGTDTTLLDSTNLGIRNRSELSPTRGWDFGMTGKYTFRKELDLAFMTLRDMAISSTLGVGGGYIMDGAEGGYFNVEVSAFIAKNLKLAIGTQTNFDIDHKPRHDPNATQGASSPMTGYIRLIYENWGLFSGGK